VHGTNGAGVVNMQSKPKAKRTNTGNCQGEHVHGTSWIAEGNKQSKRQTCLSLALLVPFRSPGSGIHGKTLGKLIKHCLYHALHMYKCAHMDMFFKCPTSLRNFDNRKLNLLTYFVSYISWISTNATTIYCNLNNSLTSIYVFCMLSNNIL
jgi:hypothetical protein